MTVMAAGASAAAQDQPPSTVRTQAARSAAVDPYAEANAGTVGIITGGLDSTAIHIANDLARALNDGTSLRIIPMIGEGSVQNISDLMYLRGIDIAVVQSDVLSHFKRSGRLPGIENRIHYIAKLHSEEFHLLSRMTYLCIDDLKGRTVNFGPEGSGMALTAQAVFDAHQVEVKPRYLDQTLALELLRRGEIDAAITIAGKPSRAFGRTRYTDHVHFLDVDYAEALRGDYLPAIITHDDYPDLVAPNETVSTIAVSTVLAVYNWRPRNERYRRVSTFIEKFFAKFDSLKQGPYHGKWREVNLFAPVSGWVRFAAARQWLDAHPPPPEPEGDGDGASAAPTSATTATADEAAPSPEVLQALFQQYLHNLGGAGNADKEALFDQFVQWYQQKKR